MNKTDHPIDSGTILTDENGVEYVALIDQRDRLELRCNESGGGE